VKRWISVYLELSLLEQLEKVATRQKLTKSVVIESAVASFLSPDSADRLEAAFARRLDRLSRQSERLERNLAIAAETLALFVRFWLTTTPPSPAGADAAAQAKAESDTEPSSKPLVDDSRGAIVSFKKYRKTCRRNKVIIPDRSETDCDPNSARQDGTPRRSESISHRRFRRGMVRANRHTARRAPSVPRQHPHPPDVHS